MSVSPPIKTPTINDKFPNLQGATQNTTDFDLYEYIGDDSWAVVFMHPGDFTPVCTTELGQAALLGPEFARRNVKLCGFSCNDDVAHRAWLADIAAYTGGEVTFPLFCDPTRQHAVQLGVLDAANRDAAGLPLTVRAVFVLKPDKTIALMLTYPASTGRNFDEIVRVIDSLQLTVQHAVATPVNWQPGQDVIVNFPLSNADADARFGPNGYRIIKVPSEQGKTLAKNYLRVTKDPSTVGA